MNTRSPSASSDRAAPSFAALRHPGYRAYLLGSALAMMADNIEHVISYWVLFEKFHSPALGGIAVLTHWLPFLFFSVYFGSLTDRFDNRRIIQISQVMFMLVSLGWGLMFLADTVELWQAVVLLAVHGFAGVVWTPASQVIIHDIVKKEDLQSAVRLSATSRYLGILLGPAVGGGLMLAFGPAIGLLVNVLIYVPLVWWLWKAPYGRRADRVKDAAPRRNWLAEMAAGVRDASKHPVILSMMLLAAASSFFVGNAFQAQMPEYAHDLGTEHADFSYSMLLAANAAGALLGGVILESRGMLRAGPRTAIVLAILWCIAIAGFSVATNYPLALALMFVAGVLNLAFSAMAQTLVQMYAPERVRGRLVGLFSLAINGMRAFSGVTVGLLGSLIGIHWSLALSALALFAVTVALLGVSLRSR